MEIRFATMADLAAATGPSGTGALTCKERLIPCYARFGFVSEGLSSSVHGDAVWYQLRLRF